MDADSALVPRSQETVRTDSGSLTPVSGGSVDRHPDWPPHVVGVERGTYRKSQIDAWLRNQEAIAQSGHQGLVHQTVPRR